MGERDNLTPDRRSGEDRRLRTIIDTLADGVVIVDAEGRVCFANPSAEALFGRSAAELEGQPFGFPLLGSETTEIDVLRRGGEPATAELRVADIEWRGAPAYVVSLRDITDRKLAEARAHELLRAQAARAAAESATRRYRFLAEASAVLESSLDTGAGLDHLADLVVPRLAEWCVIALEADGAHPESMSVAHMEPAHAAALARLARCHPPHRAKRFPTAQVLRSGESSLYPSLTDAQLAALADGEEHAALLREIGTRALIAVPLVARDAVIGTITLGCGEPRLGDAELALARDLAQRAALTLSNARLFHAAEQASRAKSDFLAVMSHELRTPLNAVIGYTDLLEAGIGGPLTEAQRAKLERIGISARHLLSLIEEILTFSRLEAGRLEVQRAPTELGELAREAASLVEPKLAGREVALVVAAPEAPLEVRTDAPKVRQILLNLLSNAAKFTERGEIRVEVDADDAWASVRVRDTGIGVPADQLQRIFEPFVQVEQGTRRQAEGTGLGLTLAARMAGALGGVLEAESREGEGSVFTLRLPRVAAAAAGAADPPAADPGLAASR